MMKGVVIGIDTSNYTTSLGIISEDGTLLANLKRMLTVKEGERGLRQSDAVFAHTKNIPILMDEAGEFLKNKRILAIGVSVRPRNQDGSYMPCFLAGLSAAKSMAVALNVPLYEFSHQCGHIMAALYSSGRTDLSDERFAAFHVSGGTTEMLMVMPSENGFCAEVVGGTLDLNAGQVIDRIGVALGLKFPCGRKLEALALSYSGKCEKKKVGAKGGYVNLSGLENIAMRMKEEGKDPSLIAAFLFNTLGRAIADMSEGYLSDKENMPFVYAGGVMCNSIIRSHIKNRGIDCYFAESEMSKDNAVGIAALALKKFKG